MSPKTAHYISTFGNPLLTIPLYSVVAVFLKEDSGTAWTVTLLLLGGVVAPILIKSYRGVQKGEYTNYDISDRKQRQSWYMLPTLLLSVVTIALYLSGQSRIIWMATLFALVLFVASQLINLFVKTSLHVGFNAYLGFLALPLSKWLGVSLLLFTIPLAWSRIVLKRHTLLEVTVGAILGLAVGWTYLYILTP